MAILTRKAGVGECYLVEHFSMLFCSSLIDVNGAAVVQSVKGVCYFGLLQCCTVYNAGIFHLPHASLVDERFVVNREWKVHLAADYSMGRLQIPE